VKLTSMKMDQTSREPMPCESTPSDRPVYPWGLSLTLDDETLTKLGIDSLPKVSSALLLTARVEVTACEEREVRHESRTEQRRSVSLQITDAALTEPDGTANAATILYDKA
jgi:hypothetical protein